MALQLASTLWRNRGLVCSMVRRDIATRYRGTLGGVLWTVLSPLVLIATYFVVFGIVLHARFDADPSRSGFVLYLLAGMLPWMGTSEAIGRAPNLILEHRVFVKKLVFPLETLAVKIVAASAATHALGLIVLVWVLLLFRGFPLSLIWLPAIAIPQILLTLGITWTLAATGVYIRDLAQITGFALTLWFFLTPICYPESQLPAGMAPLIALNPMAILIRGYRAILLEHRAPEPISLIALWALSIAAALLGYWWFGRLRKSFADVL